MRGRERERGGVGGRGSRNEEKIWKLVKPLGGGET